MRPLEFGVVADDGSGVFKQGGLFQTRCLRAVFLAALLLPLERQEGCGHGHHVGCLVLVMNLVRLV